MSVNPFHELLTLALTIRGETFERHSRWAFLRSFPKGMKHSHGISERCHLPPFHLYIRDRGEKLQQCFDAALLSAERTGFSVDEVSRRINALTDPIKHLILWEKNWKEGAPSSFAPKRGWVPPPVDVNYIISISDYTRVPGGPYILYHDHALLEALPAVRELAIRAGERSAPGGKTKGEQAEGAGAGSAPAEGEKAEGIDEQTRQEKIAKLSPTIRKAYLSYEVALLMAEKKDMEDGEAYKLLKEEGITEDGQGELTDYRLPAEGTWRRYLGKARQALGEQKYTRRRGRPHGKSIVRQDQI